MSESNSIYPPTPRGVPKDLARPSGDYRARVVLVLLCLFVFLLLYFGLIGACVYFIIKLFTSLGQGESGGTIFWRVVLAVFSAVFLLFLVKGLFKRSRPDITLHVEVHEKNHPELFAFIERVCEDTRSPLPHRVFVSPEVNAAVFYQRSLLNLFFPAKKNLLIGLGLVNVVNLSEFKAVLAHEFGHFSQNSMKVGTYVYTTNRIIADMVCARDFFDDWLSSLCRQEGGIAVVGLVLSAAVWCLRKALEGMFMVVNFADASLSRQMEFNADLVAVSVCGSDAIVHSLARLDYASQALDQTVEDLRAAADHDLYTSDIFDHHHSAGHHLRKVAKKPNWGEPPPLPADPEEETRLFEEGCEGIPPMWASHPPNDQREENAKDIYIRSPIDERSPWLLFGDPKRLREKVTARFNRLVFKRKKDFVPNHSKEVQEFINDERAETTYDPRYHGLYDSRYIDPGRTDDLAVEVENQPWPTAKLMAAYRDLYPQQLAKWMERHNERVGEHELLSGLESGDLKLRKREFEFRKEMYGYADIKDLLKKVDKELKSDRKKLDEFDRDVFQIHYRMARALEDRRAQEMLTRYDFHLESQEMLFQLSAGQEHIGKILERLNSLGSEISREEMEELMSALNMPQHALADSLKRARTMRLPALKNMTAGEPLHNFLLEEDVVFRLDVDHNMISGKWIGKLLKQIGAVHTRIKRIHFKSLGGILALQESIAADWMRRTAPATRPPPLPVRSPA